MGANRLTRSALRWITPSSPTTERGDFLFTRHCEARSNSPTQPSPEGRALIFFKVSPSGGDLEGAFVPRNDAGFNVENYIQTVKIGHAINS